MIRKSLIPLCCLLLSLAWAPSASAQRAAAGIFNSPKGEGVNVDFAPADGAFYSLAVYADFYGLLSRRSKEPGVRMNFTRNFVFKEFGDGTARYFLYAGPGLSLGWVHDFERGYFTKEITPLSKPYGAVAAVSGTAGCRFEFERGISIDLSFTGEAGLMYRPSNSKLTCYLNGILESFFPQISIMLNL